MFNTKYIIISDLLMHNYFRFNDKEHLKETNYLRGHFYITFETLGWIRFGNHMFNYAALLCIAYEHKLNPVIQLKSKAEILLHIFNITTPIYDTKLFPNPKQIQNFHEYLELTFDSRVKHLSRQHTVTAWSL
jgi:hypothetical protein